MSVEKLNVTEHLRLRSENMLTQATENFQLGDIKYINKLHHELAVHQAELELQNEELRNTQLTLQKVRDRYVELYEHAPVGYVLLDAAGIIRRTNATWRAMLKRPDDDFYGTPFAETLVEGDARVFLSRFRSLFHNPADKQIELQIKRHNTKPFYAHITAKHYISEGTENDTNEVMIVVSDISERRQAQEKLQQSKDMICLLLDSTAEAIYGVDPQGVCTFCNAACVRILGYDSADQIIGRNIHDLIHHSHADGTPLPVRDCVLLKDLDRQIHCDNEKFWHADGSSFPVEYWSYPIRQDNHKNLGLVVSFVDITERKQAEHQLKQQRTQLKQQNKALKQFNYAVSHELKTPLVTIESSLGLIQSNHLQTMDPGVTQAFGYARHAARQMHNLLESLLLMFRMDAAESESETTAFGVLVQDAVDQLSRGSKLQDITVTIAATGLDLCGDRGKMGQIWLQLIDNAAKFMGDQKHPAIDIGVEQMDQEVLFYVRDNGMGVEEPYQGKIFGLFDQLDKTVDGTGLGLALVQRIVDYYGGTVWVDSAGKGAGSCFYFTLPGALINRDTTT